MEKEIFNKLQNGDLIYVQDRIYIFDEEYKLDDETFRLYFISYNCKDIQLVTKEMLKEKHDREIKLYETQYQENMEKAEFMENRIFEENIIDKSQILESAIGLNREYSLPPKNSNGEPLEKYIAYRNYFKSTKNGKNHNEVNKLVELGYLKECTKNYYEITEKGKRYLEYKYKLEIVL